MKRWFSLLIAVSLVLSATPAFAWGPDGHKTVGRIATLFLEEHHATNALNRIKQILRQNENLSGVSIWADTIKGFQPGPNFNHPDSDTQAFLRDARNKKHADWHFVDIPLDCASYDACSLAPIKFNNAADVVQTINLCITALRSTAANPRFSKRNALRLLVHLVGDLNQPLHVGSGFINPSGPDDATVFATDPRLIKLNGLDSDHGANRLWIDDHKTKKLHGFWDSTLVKGLLGDLSITQFAGNLKSGVPVDAANWDGKNSFKTWANQWAGDAVKQSRDQAYDIAHNGVVIFVPAEHDLHAEAEEIHFAVRLAADYENKNKEVVRVQLVKAGYRLARLLEAIFP